MQPAEGNGQQQTSEPLNGGGDLSFAAVLNSLRAHVAILDEQGVILAVNEAWRDFARQNGLPEQSVGPGMNYLAICRAASEDAGEAAMVAEGIESVMRGDREQFFLDYPCHSPTQRRWFQVRASRCPGPRAARVVVAHECITEMKLAEAEARQYQAELAHLLRLGMMNEMAAGLAHELNQPLSAIANFASGLARNIEAGRADQPMQLAVLRDIAHQAERAGEMIRRMRRFVKTSEGHLKPGDVNNVVDEAIGLVRSDNLAAGVDLRVRLDRKLPLAMMDDVQVQQVVLNLSRNALEAMQSDTRAGAAKRLSVRTGETAPRMIRVDVSDTGPGVGGDVLARLFNPFFTTKDSGMGLGLSLSRSIIDAHGGELWARRNRDGGMTFSFTLPTAQEQPTHGR